MSSIPEANRIGGEGRGLFLAMSAFDHTRPPVAAAAVGVARAAMEHAIRYAKERQTFGVPIARHQSIGFMIAEMHRDIEAARLLVWKAAWKIDQGERNTLEAATAKLMAADTAMRVTTDAVQVFGGYGYNREYPVEKLMRDAKVFQIYEGTSQIQRYIVSNAVMGKGVAGGSGAGRSGDHVTGAPCSARGRRSRWGAARNRPHDIHEPIMVSRDRAIIGELVATHVPECSDLFAGIPALDSASKPRS